MSYKKIKTILVYGKKKCIFMKQKGTREYVKSKGEYVLLPVYVKRVAKIAAKKIVKIKNGKKKLRGGDSQLSLKVRVTHRGNMLVADSSHILDLCTIHKSDTELVLLSEEKNMLNANYPLQAYYHDKNWSPGGKNVTIVKINDKDISLHHELDQIMITVRSPNNENIISNTNYNQNFLINKVSSNGTAYYKRYQTGKIEEIYSTKFDYIREYETGGISKKIYYHIFELGEGEQIYSEKDRCKLQLNSGFNIEGVKKILFDDYKPPFEKLYIYDSDGYKEIDVPNPLQARNIRQLANHDKDSKNPVTHTRIAFQTPNSHSNRVTADIVGDDNRQKSKQSMISKIVDIVKQTKRTSPTYATDDPFNDHYSIKRAYENSLRKKSISSRVLSNVTNPFSRNTTQGPSLYGRSG
jgi:hypothetical protein